MVKKKNENQIPMTETAFYILLSLLQPRHGYAIIKNVNKMTDGRITLGPGTIYGTLSKMSQSELIQITAEENNRKIYQVTTLGKELLELERKRITELYQNAKEAF